jgi:pseudouridine-5'-phosphate glycosidase
MMLPYFKISQEVQEALAAKKAVVALESTIITHGMPFPENVETAKRVEQAVRNEGAVPATIAILDGLICVGLSPDELIRLGKNTQAEKVSRRDIATMVAQKKTGGTTVASTMWIAQQAGIAVFVTGGIGGVHRGGEQTFDVSADLAELAQTSVAVVCAGAKAILDLPKTLEYLETYGVPVVGYKTLEFPAFYSRTSGLGVDVQVDTPEEAARIMQVKWQLGLKGGVLIAQPLPEANDFPADRMEFFIRQAVEEAQATGITGKKITPFLLGRIKELTAGESLSSNIALILNNAKLGAQIAVSYSCL